MHQLCFTTRNSSIDAGLVEQPSDLIHLEDDVLLHHGESRAAHELPVLVPAETAICRIDHPYLRYAHHAVVFQFLLEPL